MLVGYGCIRPFCSLLTEADKKIIIVALEGLENILKVGEVEREQNGGVNQFARNIEEAGGAQTIEQLQDHPDSKVNEKAMKIYSQFFANDEEDDEVLVEDDGNQFTFGVQNPGWAPQPPQMQGGQQSQQGGGFNFSQMNQ
mmetsp:Transcript_26257/g.42528  ORF Transcript_26257/g.42528 Transcript_26257/m.42528 type:complete len:140 (+) Transcript_26257:341-760(+)